MDKKNQRFYLKLAFLVFLIIALSGCNKNKNKTNKISRSNIQSEVRVDQLKKAAPIISSHKYTQLDFLNMEDDPNKPQLIVQTGQGEVHSVAFNTEGDLLATSGDIAKLWDIKNGKELRFLQHIGGVVNSVAFSPDGKNFATSGTDNLLKLWDVTSGRELRSIPAKTMEKLIFSRDGKYIGGMNSYIFYLWDIKSGKSKTFRGRIFAFSPDSQTLALATRKIQLWDLKSGQKIRTLGGHFEIAKTLCFHPQGKILASSGGAQVKIWDIASGKELHTLQGHSDFVSAIALSPDGKILASGSKDELVQLWDVKSGKEIGSLNIKDKNNPYDYDGVNSLAFSPNGKVLACGHKKGVKLWDIRSDQEFRRFISLSRYVGSVVFSPNGKFFATAGDNLVSIWEVATCKIVHTIKIDGKKYGSNNTASVKFTSDNKFFTISPSRYGAELWEIGTWRKVRTYTGKGNTFKISLDGSILFRTYKELNQFECDLSIENTVSQAKMGSIHFNSQPKNYILNLDKSILFTSSYKGMHFWDTKTGKEKHFIKDGAAGLLTVFPNGKFIAGTKRKKVQIWDVLSVGSNNNIHAFPVPYSPKALYVSPNNKYLAAIFYRYDSETGGQWSFHIWDAVNGKELYLVKGENDELKTLDFSANSKYLVAGSRKGSLWLCDIEANKLFQVTGHIGEIKSLDFSPDSKLVAIVGGNKTTLWNADNRKTVAQAIAVNEKDYIVISPDQHYMASKGAFSGVAFRVGKNAFPFEQFDLKFNRPDLVLKKISYAPQTLINSYYELYKKRLKKMNFTEAMLGDTFHLPEVAIVSQNIPLSTRQKMIAFKIKAWDTRQSLDRINVYINDIPIYGVNGINLRRQKSSKIEQEISFELSNGNNKIQVSALNSKGIESLKQTFEINYTGVKKQATLYIASVGVSKYTDSRYNLTYAAKDAKDLIEFFHNNSSEFGSVKVLKLLDHKANKSNILQIKNFFKKSRVDDQAILFVSGHGLLDNKLDYYFATANVDFENPAIKGLPYDALENLLDGIPARKKLLLIDTCHSGEVDKEDAKIAESSSLAQNVVVSQSFKGIRIENKAPKIGLQNSFRLLQELFTDLRRGSGAMVISSASGLEYALESDDWNNGVFTYAVLEGLKTKNADLNHDGNILVSELRDYVISRVKKLTSGQQTPTSRRENLEFDFIVR